MLQIENLHAGYDDLEVLHGIDLEVNSGEIVALIGPNDLSISLGVPGEHEHPSMIEAMQKVVDACAKKGIASGIHVRDISVLQFWMERGMTFITCDTDIGLLISAAAQTVQTLRESIKD